MPSHQPLRPPWDHRRVSAGPDSLSQCAACRASLGECLVPAKRTL